MEKLTKSGEAAVQKAEADVKAEPEMPEFSDEQISKLLQNNQRAKTIFINNLQKKVLAETEKLRQTATENQETIDKLKAAQGSAAPDGEEMKQLTSKLDAAQKEKEELAQKVEAAQKEKDLAVRTAIDNAEKKAKVQISQRDIANAKIAAVQLAVKETP